MGSLGNLDLSAIRQQHPHRNFQASPRCVDDRDRAISPLRPADHLKSGAMERMEWVEDLDGRVFYAQGIVSVDAFIRMSIAWCRAGGLSTDRTRWIKPRYAFFLPVQVLSRIFRGKFVAALQCAFAEGQLSFHGDLRLLAQPKTFAAWLRPLFRKDWVVYAKPPFGGPEYVLRYLGRYTHRVAISNHRLLSFTDQKVTFRWRDSAHHNEQRRMTLALDEFLRRFPRGSSARSTRTRRTRSPTTVGGVLSVALPS